MKQVLLIALIASCSGQVNSGNQPLLVRTQGVASGNITAELQDRDGNLWFSTGGEGVYRFDGTSFTNFTTKDGLCDNHTSTIIQVKDGNILIGTKAGICTYDGKSFSSYFETDSLKNLRITTLLEDRDGHIWFGALNSGVYRFDGKNVMNFLNKDDHPFNLGNHYQLIMDILQDQNGNLWFSSWNGGGVWRYDGNSFINFLPSKEYYQSNEDGRTIDSTPIVEKQVSLSQNNIQDDMIFSISEDKNGNLWFATRRHGASRYDGNTFTRFGENDAFVNYGVYSILEDKKGNLWFSTDKNGVFVYDGKTFKNYTTADGLVNNSVFSMLEDIDGNLWFGTRGFGLSRFDGNTFTTFSN